MANIFNNQTYSDTAASNVASGLRHGPSLDTGDLRRKFNFGDRVSELAIAQDPFFRFVSQVSKVPTDDPSFKYTEKRGSWHKRYAYVSNHGASAPATTAGTDANATIANLAQGNTYFFTMITDYLSAGNKANVYGQSSNEISPGDTGTKPEFFIPGQLVKIPYSSSLNGTGWDHASTASKPESYLIVKVKSATVLEADKSVNIETEVVSSGSSSTDVELLSFQKHNLSLNNIDVSGYSVHDYLESKRCYVIGSAFAEGSGYPETWKDQPYSTAQGQTQIFKTTCAMSNTMRATSLKYEQNEWARIWRDKLIEHKYDIEQSLLFGSQYTDANGVGYTQGAVDFISTFGNTFQLDLASKSQDDFLNDMSEYMDPRYNNGGATVFFCRTDIYNWLHKIGSNGYAYNNHALGDGATAGKGTFYKSDLQIISKQKAAGIDTTKISTIYGDMNVVRNIHLDGTNVAILGIDMKHCMYRPLVGNGINRDTSVYVGVQTLENSGVDRRVDQILTEAGMQWEMPESHAIWVG